MSDEISPSPEPVETLSDRVRKFVDQQVIPAEPQLAAGNSDTWSGLRERAVAAGLWALPLPAEHGGGGLDTAGYFAVAEQEGRSDFGPDALGSSALPTVRMLDRHGHPELCAELVPALVSGTARAAYAMTEPGVPGSDPSALRTVATPDGDRWRITGRKWFTSGAARADYVLVVARTAEGPAREAFSIFVVPTSAPGFRVVRELDVLGAGGQYELTFDDVVVSSTQLVGAVGSGLRLAGQRLALGRTLRALRWVGQAQRAVELLAERANRRRIGDGMLADRQLVQQMVFDSEVAVRSARLLTERAAQLVAADEPAQVEVSIAKVAAARALGTAVDAAIQVHGAEGLTEASGLPGLLRVARSARILDGPDEFHVTATARRLLRGYATTPTG
ncbi:acyl-CoA dehydrogenase family protein [Nocardia veterana]|uniref:Acyl-CoA dehydrogenase n=1 Tax=Nocardia veterana TaxID=132249 RepID=A0A7X6LTX7_9NOCA|nr:acyl-CoA dehydrogenase family protein [Nocardia veterana]NKY84508.1 acyl-CoA dehydrogenase [Nocardia veterana]